MPRRKPPSRVRYEAEHPSLTVRVPAQVKARVLAAAQAEGYERGRAAGQELGGSAGFRAGVLSALFAADQGRSYSAPTIAARLAEQPDQLAIAERLIPADFQREWARLLRAAGHGRAPATSA